VREVRADRDKTLEVGHPVIILLLEEIHSLAISGCLAAKHPISAGLLMALVLTVAWMVVE
jgi:hypothetical protein